MPGKIWARHFRSRLSDFDLGQLLDGLSIRAEAWCKTADYMDTDEQSGEFFVCEECNDAGEARKIAEHYKQIITNIEMQIEQQRAQWSASANNAVFGGKSD